MSAPAVVFIPHDIPFPHGSSLNALLGWVGLDRTQFLIACSIPVEHQVSTLIVSK